MNNSDSARFTPLRDSFDREPELPANSEAEQALLGAIFMNNAAYGRVADFLRPEHFANGVHGRIFAAIGKQIDAGTTASPVTL